MGAYINPKHMTKEDWLLLHGESFNLMAGWGHLKKGYLPVCLIYNNYFTAAEICYSEKEFKAFLHPDERPKRWYQVSIEKLHEVSPELKKYMR